MIESSLFTLPGDHVPQPHGNCYWLVPGVILAGEYPVAPDEPSSLERLQAILGAGVTQFFDLTEPSELPAYSTLLKLLAGKTGVEAVHVRHAVRDMSVPSRPKMRMILDELATAAAAGHCTYLHCWGGIGRTGTVVGCLLVDAGFSADDAIALIASKWLVMEKRQWCPESPQTPEQFAFIRNWKA
ncbi:MAG: hypothetical protein ABI831_04845 [Betaproteobacteria bacterium]